MAPDGAKALDGLTPCQQPLNGNVRSLSLGGVGGQGLGGLDRRQRFTRSCVGLVDAGHGCMGQRKGRVGLGRRHEGIEAASHACQLAVDPVDVEVAAAGDEVEISSP